VRVRSLDFSITSKFLTSQRVERGVFWSILVLEFRISRVQVRLICPDASPSNIDVPSGLATIANMGAEVGATTSTFPYSARMKAYLEATGRAPVARAADTAASQGFLSADEGAEYDEVIEIASYTIPLG
jgi:hypothetical protein